MPTSLSGKCRPTRVGQNRNQKVPNLDYTVGVVGQSSQNLQRHPQFLKLVWWLLYLVTSWILLASDYPPFQGKVDGLSKFQQIPGKWLSYHKKEKPTLLDVCCLLNFFSYEEVVSGHCMHNRFDNGSYWRCISLSGIIFNLVVFQEYLTNLKSVVFRF